MTANVPWENGPVFNTDSDDIVDSALERAGVADFFREREELEEATLLLDLDDQDQDHGAISLALEEVNELLIQHLARRPELMHDIHPRKFEELVAAMFRSMGYEVEITPRSKDGGRDLLAFQKTGVGTLVTLVECKRFSPDRKVGVSLVRSLYGVVEHERASHGVLATTSSFTRGARNFQQTLKYRLSLNDFDDLARWAKTYRRR